MKLLVLTQKIDQRDALLGFFHDWILEFSKSCGQITVICLEKGEYELPADVQVFSLGKERVRSRLKYVLNFYKLIWRLRNDYDAVFVHMNPEYVILGGLLWRLLSKKIFLWYNHRQGGVRARLAFLFSQKIFYTSSYAFAAKFKKAKLMPAGIDTDKFKLNESIAKIPKSILSLGRISPVKHIEVIIEALQKLDKRGVNYVADIYGGPTDRDRVYYDKIRALAEPLEKKGKVVFHQAVPNHETPVIYSAHDLFINATPKGSFDKTVLEAALCGVIPIVANVSFADIFPQELFFKEGDAGNLAMTFESLLALSPEQKERIQTQLRVVVTEKHGLATLARNVLAIYTGVI